MAQQPHVEPLAPLVLYHILGASLPDTAAAAPLWPAAVACARHNPGAVHRALEAPQELPDAALGNALFDAIVGAREGTVITDHAYEDVWSLVVYPDRRVRLAIPRLLDWLGRLDPADVAAPARYPYVLAAGQRRMFNANQIFRNPAWRRSDPDGARLVNPDDLAALGVRDGDWVAVESPNGRLVVRSRSDESMCRGHIALPHGYGMGFPAPDVERLTNGPRINLLTSSDRRDPIAGIPYHKNVPARLDRATPDEALAAEAVSRRIHASAT